MEVQDLACGVKERRSGSASSDLPAARAVLGAELDTRARAWRPRAATRHSGDARSCQQDLVNGPSRAAGVRRIAGGESLAVR